MAENFDREGVEAVSSLSLQTVHFEPMPFDLLFHVNQFELVNYILTFQHITCLVVYYNVASMVENLCRK